MAATLHGKVIAVTGAASGIGLATARAALDRGASVAISDRVEDALEQAAADLRKSLSTDSAQKVTHAVVDVTDDAAVDGWIASVAAEHGRLDGAANVAGVAMSPPSQLANTPNDVFDRVIDVNLRGVFFCMRAELKNMTRGASIVNVSSVTGLGSLPYMCAYSATKYAVIGLTKSAAREVAADGIRINAVAPGAIDTGMTHDALNTKRGREALLGRAAFDRAAEASEVATVICHLLSEDASYVTGAVNVVDGGLLA